MFVCKCGFYLPPPPLTPPPGVTKALHSMNKKMNLPQLQKIMMQFERESEIMDLKEETISDTIDDVIGGDDEEEVHICNSCTVEPPIKDPLR